MEKAKAEELFIQFSLIIPQTENIRDSIETIKSCTIECIKQIEKFDLENMDFWRKVSLIVREYQFVTRKDLCGNERFKMVSRQNNFRFQEYIFFEFSYFLEGNHFDNFFHS